MVSIVFVVVDSIDMNKTYTQGLQNHLKPFGSGRIEPCWQRNQHSKQETGKGWGEGEGKIGKEKEGERGKEKGREGQLRPLEGRRSNGGKLRSPSDQNKRG